MVQAYQVPFFMQRRHFGTPQSYPWSCTAIVLSWLTVSVEKGGKGRVAALFFTHAKDAKADKRHSLVALWQHLSLSHAPPSNACQLQLVAAAFDSN